MDRKDLSRQWIMIIEDPGKFGVRMIWLSVSLILTCMSLDVCSEPLNTYTFAFPYYDMCADRGREGPCRDKLFLAHQLAPGSKVVLVGDAGTCGAGISAICSYCDNWGEHTGSVVAPDDEWNLPVDRKCLERFSVAVIGVEHNDVRLVPFKPGAPLSGDIESRARQKLTDSEKEEYRITGWPVSEIPDSPPKVLEARQAKLLFFHILAKTPLRSVQETEHSEQGFGRPVLVVNDFIMPLLYSNRHCFFTVYGKLHLTFQETCPTRSRIEPRMYDLSGEIPKLITTSIDDSRKK